MSKPSGWHRKRKDTPAEKARDARYRTPEYRAADRAFAQLVNAGRGYCWRCSGWIDPHLRDGAGKRAWHVGHEGEAIRGPEHNGCNLRAAAQAGAAVRNAVAKRVRSASGGGPTKVRL